MVSFFFGPQCSHILNGICRPCSWMFTDQIGSGQVRSWVNSPRVKLDPWSKVQTWFHFHLYHPVSELVI